MALDNGYPFATYALPTPNDTPYETPSRGISGQSSWQGSSSPHSNSSPAPFPQIEESYLPRQRGAGDTGDEKRYSTHDPRRHTPNLSISFVSQIHSLKKELESKDDLVENLEENLHQAKDDLDSQKAEVKSVKFQMQSLEHDMLQALEGMAKQRDNAVESVADTRKRLDASKRKAREQEEDAAKLQELWETEKQAWEDKKRKLESKVHTVEERLKTMVAEMLAVQSTGENRPGADHNVDEGNDTWNDRTTSRQSNRSVDDTYGGRESMTRGGSKTRGLSLADELELDENAEGEGDDRSGQDSIIDDYNNFPRRHSAASYTDSGTQFTPPTSPTLQQQQIDLISEKPAEQIERAANQSRKRVAIPHIFVEQTSVTKQETPKAPRMFSAGCQTVEQPQQTIFMSDAVSPSVSATEATMSASTQTSEDALPVSEPAGSRLAPMPLDVPIIAIHPPASRPPSSHNSVVLPPRTKNAACQVVIEMPRHLRSTAMQTEEIRIDRRPIRIPPRLQPSVFSPPIPVGSSERRTHKSQTSEESAAPAPPIRKVRSPPPTLRDQIWRPSSPKIRDAYPGNNDNGPLDSKQRCGPRRPIRTESIFAGFEDVNDVGNDVVHSDLSDDDFATAAPIRKTLSKVQNSWKLVPQSQGSVLDKLESASEKTGDQKGNDAHEIPQAKAPPQSTSKSFQSESFEGSRKVSRNSKEADMRRKAPFPVPIRASSRRIPISASDGTGSPAPYTTSFFTARRVQESGRPPIERKILRKTQSAAPVIKEPTRRPPPPPPSISTSSTVPASPMSSLPSRNQFVLHYDSVPEFPRQLSRVSRPQSHAGSATIDSPGQQTSVVDAIAQTMIGEYMWKYKRRRTSFGITENPQAEFEMGRNGETGNSTGGRHKRWVWLAPYENAVIWSGKQPTSGAALLGKGGRKCTSYQELCFNSC